MDLCTLGGGQIVEELLRLEAVDALICDNFEVGFFYFTAYIWNLLILKNLSVRDDFTLVPRKIVIFQLESYDLRFWLLFSKNDVAVLVLDHESVVYWIEEVLLELRFYVFEHNWLDHVVLICIQCVYCQFISRKSAELSRFFHFAVYQNFQDDVIVGVEDEIGSQVLLRDDFWWLFLKPILRKLFFDFVFIQAFKNDLLIINLDSVDSFFVDHKKI